MATHELKIVPPFFADVLEDRKSFEIRKNDRAFSKNDILILREWVNNAYTGRRVNVMATYIFNGADYPNYGLDKDYVVMGIVKI